MIGDVKTDSMFPCKQIPLSKEGKDNWDGIKWDEPKINWDEYNKVHPSLSNGNLDGGKSG